MDLTIRATAEETIRASAGDVYELIADLPRMGEWSPENLGASWVDGAPGQVGAKFIGRNRRDDVEWDGGGIVIAATPNREFAWVMGDDVERPHGTWRYTLDEVDEGVRVVGIYELGPGASGYRAFLEALPPADAEQQAGARAAELQSGMATTLGRMKAHLEGNDSSI